MNTGSFAICIHILTLLTHDQEHWLSSSKIAASININPVLVRKELLKLKEAGMIQVKEGKCGGSKLALSPDHIFLSDVFKITNGEHLFSFAKNEPNQECPVGKSINTWLENLYSDIDDSVVQLLDNKSLTKFIQQFV